MKKTIAKTSKNLFRFVVNSQTLSLLFVLLSVFLIWRNFKELPIAVPLWFSRPWGEMRLAEPNFLWILPLACFGLITGNYMLGKFFERREPVLSHILLWSNVVIGWLFFYTLFEIVRISS